MDQRRHPTEPGDPDRLASLAAPPGRQAMRRVYIRLLLLVIILLGWGLRLWRLDDQELRGDEVFGYFFSLRACCLGEHVVVAGCRSMTIEQYRQHVADNYPERPKAAETLAILDFLEVRRDQIFAEWGGL